VRAKRKNESEPEFMLDERQEIHKTMDSAREAMREQMYANDYETKTSRYEDLERLSETCGVDDGPETIRAFNQACDIFFAELLTYIDEYEEDYIHPLEEEIGWEKELDDEAHSRAYLRDTI